MEMASTVPSETADNHTYNLVDSTPNPGEVKMELAGVAVTAAAT